MFWYKWLKTVNVLPRPVVNFSTAITEGGDSSDCKFYKYNHRSIFPPLVICDGDTSAGQFLHRINLQTQVCTQPRTLQLWLQADVRPQEPMNMIVKKPFLIVQFAASDNSICPLAIASRYRSDIGTFNSTAMDIHRANPSSASVANPGSVCYPVMGTFDVGL